MSTSLATSHTRDVHSRVLQLKSKQLESKIFALLSTIIILYSTVTASVKLHLSHTVTTYVKMKHSTMFCICTGECISFVHVCT